MQASGFRAHGGDRFFVLPVHGLGPTESGATHLGYLSGLRKARFAVHARPQFVRLGSPEIYHTKRTKGGMSAPQRHVQLCLASTISARKRGDATVTVFTGHDATYADRASYRPGRKLWVV